MRKIKKILVLLILMLPLMIFSLTVKAEDTTVEELEENSPAEVTEYFNETIIPWVLTAVAGFSGSGIVSLIFVFILNSTKKKAAKEIVSAGEQLRLSKETVDKANEYIDKLIKALNVVVEETLSKFSTKIDTTITNKLEAFNLSANDIIESRKAQKELAEEILKKVGEELEDKEEDIPM